MHPLGVLTLTSLLIGFVACNTVTAVPEGGPKRSQPPTYEARKDYFFWGLSGEHHINVQEVCSGRKPVQVQARDTFTDGLYRLFTLGIYSPRTARVWCE